jgi:hypothetical protein
MFCLIKRQEENIRHIQDEKMKSEYMRDVLRIIADSPEDVTAPVVLAEITRLYRDYFGVAFSFEKLKEEYNQLMLKEEAWIQQVIKASGDPLLTALKFARTGNYIDFAAMGSVDRNKLMTMLENAGEEDLSEAEYVDFRKDLQKAGRLVYLTDNCGEIVLDKLLITVMKELYPSLDITVIVRGMPVVNDATLEDARMVGLTSIVKVIGNGTQIAGTQLNMISEEAGQAISLADVLISKGQGNFETLHGCGLNIYYMFLCKCDLFVKRFNMERYKGVFISEKNLRI